jgi:hypothetical protein
MVSRFYGDIELLSCADSNRGKNLAQSAEIKFISTRQRAVSLSVPVEFLPN